MLLLAMKALMYLYEKTKKSVYAKNFFTRNYYIFNENVRYSLLYIFITEALKNGDHRNVFITALFKNLE